MSSSSSDEEAARAREALAWFDRVADADEAGRAALLSTLQKTDPATHARVLRLLAADAAAAEAHFLDEGALAGLIRLEDAPAPPRDLAGQQLGPWRLERLLGSGGAGDVWLGRRSDGQHEGVAAIKLLRGTGFGAAASQRFAREGRLLARLHHRHIAYLLDVGEADGQRYLVLEYIDGERIDAFCDRTRATVETRLRLFEQIREAVAYAHANLVVHRDLKPSNILVQRDGTAKLLDFGVAKLLGDEDDPAAGELTGAQPAPFTPEYAAPEQFRNQPITVATDVYALGAVLFVLLVGRRPHEGRAPLGGLDGPSARTDPPRLSSTRPRPEAERVALERGTTPARLRRLLRGDLDTIVARALKPDPAERYPSVAALAADVRRHLERRPIQARADSALYRARKFVQRHRAGVALAGLAAAVVIGSGAALVVEARQLQREVVRATTIKDLLLDSYRSADLNRDDGSPARDAPGMLRHASRSLDERADIDAETRAEVYATLAGIFSSMNRYADAQDNYRKARDLHRAVDGEASLHALSLEQSMLLDERHHGHFVELLPRVERLLEAVGVRPGADWQRLRWGALDIQSMTLRSLGDLDAARRIEEQRLVELRAAGADQGEDEAASLQALAWIACDRGLPSEADEDLRAVMRIARRTYPPTHPATSVMLLAAADVLGLYGDDTAALELARAAVAQRLSTFGPRHIATAWAYTTAAGIADQLDRDEEAARDFAGAAQGESAVDSPNPSGQAIIHLARGLFLLRRDRCDAATVELSRCVELYRGLGERWHGRRATCAAGVAYCAARPPGNDPAALAALEAIIPEARAHRARDLPLLLWLRSRLASSGVASASAAEQRAWLDEAARILAQTDRAGSRLGRDVEAARIALGAVPAPPPAPRGAELLRLARELAAAAALK